jgi:two-component system OmpR family response regulator
LWALEREIRSDTVDVMITNPRIIVVEDDPEIRVLIVDYLRRQSFRADAADGGAALDRLLSQFEMPDLIVLDLMLPGEDGLAICRRLRATSRVPIIMLTAKAEDVDRIIGLEMGADDYIAKPFNPRELAARIRAVLRRFEPIPDARRTFAVGALKIDLDALTVMHGSAGAIELTSAEFALLECFVTRPYRVLSRDQLMDWTRGRRAEALDRTIDVQVSRLRKKIEIDGEAIIKTVRSIGYQLVAPVTEL